MSGETFARRSWKGKCRVQLTTCTINAANVPLQSELTHHGKRLCCRGGDHIALAGVDEHLQEHICRTEPHRFAGVAYNRMDEGRIPDPDNVTAHSFKAECVGGHTPCTRAWRGPGGRCRPSCPDPASCPAPVHVCVSEFIGKQARRAFQLGGRCRPSCPIRLPISRLWVSDKN